MSVSATWLLGFVSACGTSQPQFSPDPIYEETALCSTTFSNNGDEADIYYPVTEQSVRLPMALLLQGGRVDKQYYSKFSAALASYGFIVVVPNHHSSFTFPGYEGEGLFSEVSQLADVVEFLSEENTREGAPIKGLVDTSTLVALGHSYGSAAIISAVQNRCDYPFCQEGSSYQRPAELKAVALGGISTRPSFDPDHLGVQPTANLALPFAIFNGSLEGNALLDDAKASYDLITDGPKALIIVEGANHYGMCDMNNAPGPLVGDPNNPVLAQEQSIAAMARWAALFLRAHALDDEAAWNYVHNGGDAGDSNVTVFADPPGDRDLDIGPHIGLEWISVPAGSFDQGNSSATEAMSDELPVRTVTLADFEILRTEVTVAQYAACVAADWCSEPDVGDRANWMVAGRDQHPINYVDWSQAVTFCDWVRARLPTESEWEYAARNQGSDTYPWGEAPVDCDHAVIKEESASGCGGESSSPVCSKPSGNTDSGLCDMIGNVWEWTVDWYHDSYAGAPLDGSSWVEPRGESRVMRGGAFSYDAFWNRATARDGHGNPAFRVYTVGFRCVRGDYVAGDYQAPIVAPGGDGDGDGNDCDERECDFTCAAQACANPDGNSHDDCDCDADYCVPDESGVDFAGQTPLTCTARDCDPEVPATCPPGSECKVIPDFVIDLMADKGIIMPARLCGS